MLAFEMGVYLSAAIVVVALAGAIPFFLWRMLRALFRSRKGKARVKRQVT
jgi:hypothetical protein